MIVHLFGDVVFLNLHDAHQHLVGHTPMELFEYLETIYVTDTQKRDDITAMDTKIRQPFSMDMMVKSYLMDMISAWFTLSSLGTTINNAKMIRLCLVKFTKNPEMNEACEKWEDSLVCTYVH